MKAWRVVRHGPPSVALELGDVELPVPGPGQARVATRATACNFNEVDGCYGRYRTIDPPLPYTLGMEVTGVVDAAGPGAEAWLGLGAELALDSRDAAALADGVLGATRGRGVDVACDLVGGAATEALVPLMARGGRLVMAGFSGDIGAEDTASLTPRPLLFGNFSLGGVMIAYHGDGAKLGATNLLPRAVGDAVQQRLVRWLDEGRIRPVVGRVSSWRELPLELERLEARRTMGRTVVDWRAA